SPQHLDGNVSSTVPYFTYGVRYSEVSRKAQFNYPDYRDGWFSSPYHSDYFYNWLRETGNASKLYQSGADLMLIHDWLARAFFTRTFPPPGVAENNYKVEANVLKDILAFVDQHPQGKLFDRNLLLLILANQAFGDRNSEEGYSYFKRIDPKSLEGSSNRYEYIEKIFFLNMMKQLATNLASSGYGQDAINMAEQFVNREERVYAYLFMTESVYQQDANPDAFIYLDSAFSYANRIDFTSLNFGLDSRYNMILLLSRMGGSEINSKAVEILREIPEQGKFAAILARVVGVAYE